MVTLQAVGNPKRTFVNLPPQKQQRVIAEAVQEFAAMGYQRASLNTIVRRLGIAKGSLYQYFENKEALFLYLFERFTDLVKETLQEFGASGPADFFGQIRRSLQAGIEFINRYPEFYEIYLKLLFEQDVPQREALIAKVRLFSLEYFGPLCEEARKQGLIRQDLPTHTIVFMLDATLDRFLQGYAKSYLDGGLALAGKDKHELNETADMVLEILKDGLSPRS